MEFGLHYSGWGHKENDMTLKVGSALRNASMGSLIALLAAGAPLFAQSAPANTQQNPPTTQQQNNNQDGWQRFGGGWSNQNSNTPRATTPAAPSPTTATPVEQGQTADQNPPATLQDDSQDQQQPEAQLSAPAVPPANAPADATQAPAKPWQLTMPAGTFITIRTNEPLSSDRNKEGDSFSATLVQPVIVNGVIVAQRGQTVGGRVTEAKKAGRVSGTSELKLELTGLTLADGTAVQIESQLARFSGGTSQGRDAAAIAGTTGFGAAVGAAAAGGIGAGMGAGAGLVASTIGVLVTRGRPTILYPETQLTFQTSAPVTIDTERSPQSFRVATSANDYSQAPPTANGNYPPRYGYSYCAPYGCGAYPYYAAYGPYYYPYPYYWGPGFGFYYGPRFYRGFRGGYGFRR